MPTSNDTREGERIAVPSLRRLTITLFASLGVAAPALLLASSSAFATCPNEGLRFGRSAALPDCRAYELVTPENLGRTQDMTFSGDDYAMPSVDGEQLALETVAPVEPPNSGAGVSLRGTRLEFVRTPHGWTFKSGIAPGMTGDRLNIGLLSPDLSQVAFNSEGGLNAGQNEESPNTLVVGPWGGPYETAAIVPDKGDMGKTTFLAANSGTASVPAFKDVLFQSADHSLLPPGSSEGTLAEQTLPGYYDLYDWTEGHLELANVEGEGPSLKLINKCGGGKTGNGPVNINTISADGSKIFIETPSSGPNCEGPNRVYMRVDGHETVEIPAEPGAHVELAGATPSGSTAFVVIGLHGGELDEFNTETRQLTDISYAEPPDGYTAHFELSEDGSTIYWEPHGDEGHIFRYQVGSGQPPTEIAFREEHFQYEDSMGGAPSGNGQFLLFTAESVRGEPRGGGKNYYQLYRYDNTTKKVNCVSCGEGDAPVYGEAAQGNDSPAHGEFQLQDEAPPYIQISENGQRVFFQTDAQLVPQDVNTISSESAHGQPLGQDVYEWEEYGTEEEPGVFCRVVNGCTHLISSGEKVGPAVLLGASRNGDNVFFATNATLTPNSTPEFSNIYDARVDGGFLPAPVTPECLSCQGLGSPPPLFSPGASLTFVGVGNIPPNSLFNPPLVTTTNKMAKCIKPKKLEHGKCVTTKTKAGKRTKRAKAHKGGKRS
jgi:hypothetical protein